MEIHLDVKKLWQREIVVHLGGAICEDGSSDTEIRRITTGANAWKKVEVW